LLSGV